jgi:alkanesulfonate monooxygenase SsuD/methylene tetrahydromethanopterin reductase-like flavin-dependent oxidoreductase (luciferase family)
MPESLGLGLIQIDPQRGAGWRAGEIQDIGRAAEDAGFGAAFCAEVNNDAIASAELMGLATSRLKVGTWVAHIYLRLPYLCAKAAALAADATDGFILGLGVSHQPVNRALGIVTHSDTYNALHDEEVSLFPDAHETLDRLKELGIKLALITNGAAEPQRAKVVRFRPRTAFRRHPDRGRARLRQARGARPQSCDGSARRLAARHLDRRRQS